MSCAHGLRSRDSTCEISTPFVSRIGAGCAIPLALAKKAVIAKQAGIERSSRCLGSTWFSNTRLYEASRRRKAANPRTARCKKGRPRSHAMFTGLDSRILLSPVFYASERHRVKPANVQEPRRAVYHSQGFLLASVNALRISALRCDEPARTPRAAAGAIRLSVDLRERLLDLFAV